MNSVVLEYTLTDITDLRALTVGLRTRPLRAVQAAVALAGVPVGDVHVEVTACRWLLLRVAVAVQGQSVDAYAYIGTRGWRAALDETLEHKRQVPMVHALMTQTCTTIEALHPGLLEDMCRTAELMYADARRLTIRDRLVVRLRWAAMLKVIPDETRAAAAHLANLAARRASPEVLRDAAEHLGPGCAGLLATVHEVVTLSGGDLDRR